MYLDRFSVGLCQVEELQYSVSRSVMSDDREGISGWNDLVLRSDPRGWRRGAYSEIKVWQGGAPKRSEVQITAGNLQGSMSLDAIKGFKPEKNNSLRGDARDQASE
jgi:hypothetical protein